MLPDPIKSKPLKSKNIADPLYGSVSLEKDEVKILDTPQFQRLRNIKQLGLSHFTYPSACHTRLEHTLGVLHMTQEMSESLGLDKEETKINRIAALFHDTGHGPFSHASEQINVEENIDHENFSCKVVEELENKINCDVEKVKDTITGRRKENNLIQGPINADRMDYLMRDSHHTGVKHGKIDVDKIVGSLMKYNDEIVFNSRAIQSIENLLTSRYHMYKSVYKHHACRSAENMLSTCMEELSEIKSVEEIMKMDDCTFMNEGMEHLNETEDVLQRIGERNLYKTCYVVKNMNSSKEMLKQIEEQVDPTRLRTEIANEAGLPLKYVLIDPIKKPKQINNVKVYHNNETYNLQEFSSLCKGLDMWELEKLSVFVPEEHRDEVGEIVKKILSRQLDL